jgi:2-dehydropantoate 2-reductase
MKQSFLVVGAGAIGTYLGLNLALQGHEVVYLEKVSDIPALERRGVSMVCGDQEIRTSQIGFCSGFEILQGKNFDLIILALKTYHLDALLPELIEQSEHLPPLLCLQNGVNSEKKIMDALGENAVIPGTVTSAVDRIEKGKVILQKKRGMGIAGNHPRVKIFQDEFNQAGLNCQYYRRADAMKWSKLIINLLGNASSAILNLPPSAIFTHSGLFKMELDELREGLKVMNREQIPVVNLPGVPVRILAAVVQLLPAGLSQPILSGMIGKGRGEKMPSFHIDLYSGKGNSEVEELNGAIAREGERLGVNTPVNTFLTNLLLGLISGEIPLNKYQNQPEQFLADLKRFKEDRSVI